jgi:hypothetical protein
MADRNKQKDADAAAVALALGRDAAKRAVEDLLSGDEERADEAAERAAASKSRRNKLIVYGVVGLLVLVGLFGMVVSYWQWFLLAGLLAVLGLYGWSRLRKRLRAGSRAKAGDARIESAASQLPMQEQRDASGQREGARVRAEERARDAQALEEASAVAEREIEDELAAMKARLDE